MASEEPIANPGLPAHLPRPTDVDERAARRAERQVATFFVLSMVCTVLFVVAYFALDIKDGNQETIGGLGASNVALGVSLGLALLFIGIGIIQWARKLMADVEIIEYRHPAVSPPADREETLAALSMGLDESGIGRRPLIRNTLFGALGLMGLPLIVGLRDLGPLPGKKLESTFWKAGTRVVNDVTGLPIKPSDVAIGQLVNAQPEGLVPVAEERPGVIYLEGVELNVEKAKSSLIVVRMEPDDITFSKDSPENWQIDGILAYSKICTHVGCPISLYEQQTHHVLCPCHQSTFDLADGAAVIFGPAARPLPQLPITVDDEGYLVAQSDFTEPVGPSYWERDSQ
ncbi:MAG: Rieske 2Fe-2S domain-containing protein [Nocardioides sp.]